MTQTATPTHNSTRGASFLPGHLSEAKRVLAEAKKPVFDVKAWHRQKAQEVKDRQKMERQIESCYARYVPAQIREANRGMVSS